MPMRRLADLLRRRAERLRRAREWIGPRLAERAEQRREVTRQQSFHQEKMAAVGSMASAIGHEVSNPIAAIAGVARFMVKEIGGAEDEKSRRLHDFAAEIGAQGAAGSPRGDLDRPLARVDLDALRAHGA